MDFLMGHILILCVLPAVFLVIYSLFLLAKHDWNKRLFGDKWGIWGIICFLLGITLPPAALIIRPLA